MLKTELYNRPLPTPKMGPKNHPKYTPSQSQTNTLNISHKGWAAPPSWNLKKTWNTPSQISLLKPANPRIKTAKRRLLFSAPARALSREMTPINHGPKERNVNKKSEHIRNDSRIQEAKFTSQKPSQKCGDEGDQTTARKAPQTPPKRRQSLGQNEPEYLKGNGTECTYTFRYKPALKNEQRIDYFTYCSPRLCQE